MTHDVDYVLPLKWSDDNGLAELATYLRSISERVRVTVVDGSPPIQHRRHREVLPEAVNILAVDKNLALNGKVAGILTALPTLTASKIIIADDDVRYTSDNLAQISRQLDDYALVRPQNYFVAETMSELPWHAQWDTARTLLNRAVGSDYPGTLAVRREYLAPGYDGDVLFENLELIRTVKARGGRELRANDLYVPRRPPTTRGFLNQRVRQAYDSLCQPGRLAVELLILPLTVVTATRHPPTLLYGVTGVILAAEVGRRRHNGSLVFPTTASLWAPVWVLERGLCIWFALVHRIRGGMRYHHVRLQKAAHSFRTLRRRQRDRSTTQ